MPETAKIINLSTARTESHKEIRTVSGRQIAVSSGASEDILEVFAPDGALELKMRLTENGPVMVVEGVRLQIKSQEMIRFTSKQIELEAKESLRIKSSGKAEITSSDEMTLHSPEDIRVTGKIIHLN